jgi:phage terminase large subunit-like protein
MPWQRYVADVLLEVDPDTGRLAYQEFGLTVPRQSGKSTLILAKAVHRASATQFFGPRQRIVYTAQTRQKAREKWEEDYAADLETSRAFKAKVQVHKGNGNEHVRFSNRSRFGIEANTEKAGHGGTLDEAYIDEAFAQADGRLEQAFGPAMITRANKQLGWISTAGWRNGSPYLEAKVAYGRRQVELGANTGLAYFEWSADEDADPEDEGGWWDFMPALGHTITPEAIRAELARLKDQGDLNDFRRAYMNQWVNKNSATDSIIPMGVWLDLAAGEPFDTADVAFAVDVSPDRDSAAIGAARRVDGISQVDVADHRPGVEWVIPRMVELDQRYRPIAWVLDPSGPAGSLLPALKQVGIVPTLTGPREMAQACGAFFDAAVGPNPVLRHLDEPSLNAALAAATKRPLGDAWAWSRKSGDITPLVAATLALHGYSLYASNPATGGWMVGL